MGVVVLLLSTALVAPKLVLLGLTWELGSNSKTLRFGVQHETEGL